ADPLVRQISAWALNVYRPASDATVAGLGVRLRDRDVKVREAAVLTRYQLRSQAKPVLPAVVEGLPAGDHVLRTHLPLILHAHPKEAVPLLVARMASNEEGVRVAAITALAGFGADAQATLPTVLKALEDRSPLVKLHAAA